MGTLVVLVYGVPKGGGELEVQTTTLAEYAFVASGDIQ